MISYLNTVQCVPYKRLCSMLEECFNIKLSQGTVRNILQDMKTNSNDVCQEIHSRIMNSPVVGADETGEYVNGNSPLQHKFKTVYVPESVYGNEYIMVYFPYEEITPYIRIDVKYPVTVTVHGLSGFQFEYHNIYLLRTIPLQYRPVIYKTLKIFIHSFSFDVSSFRAYVSSQILSDVSSHLIFISFASTSVSMTSI